MSTARAFSALLRLELDARRQVLAAALLVGVAAIPLAYLTRQQPVVFAVALAIAFCSGTAALLGAAMLAEPLAQGRLGFFLAQPLGTGVLWWGKLLGVVLVATLAAIATLLPALLWRVSRLEPMEEQALVLWALALAAVPLLAALGHLTATLVRARSWRVALDFAGLLGVAALSAWSFRALTGAAIDARFTWIAPLALVPLLAIVAGQAQLQRGRGDFERGHVALSATLWLPLLVFAALTLGFVGAALDLDLDEVEMRPPPFGGVVTAGYSPWVVVVGGAASSRDAWPMKLLRDDLSAFFLLNVDSGDWARLGPVVNGHPLDYYLTEPTLSDDGTRIVWGTRAGDAYWADLPKTSGRPAGRRELHLIANSLPPDLAHAYTWSLSPDGRHLAVVLYAFQASAQTVQLERSLSSVLVMELPAGRPLLSLAMPWQKVAGRASEADLDPATMNLRWRGAARLELAACLSPGGVPSHGYAEDSEGVAAAFAELDLATGHGARFSAVRSFDDPECPRYRLTEDGAGAGYVRYRRASIANPEDEYTLPRWTAEAAVRDTSGAPEHRLGLSQRPFHVVPFDDAVLMLSREVRSEDTDSLAVERLHRFDRDGSPIAESAFPPGVSAELGGEVEPGRLVLLLSEPSNAAHAEHGQAKQQRVLLLDVATGHLDPIDIDPIPSQQALMWAFGYWWFARSAPTWEPAAGTLAAQLYFTRDGSLVRLDAERGELRVVHAPPAARN